MVSNQWLHQAATSPPAAVQRPISGVEETVWTRETATADAKEKSWVGKYVMLKSPMVACEQTNAGKKVRSEPYGIVHSVVDEAGERLCVRNWGREGWVDKSDVVTTKDAVAFFTEIIKTSPTSSWAWSHADGLAIHGRA